MKMKLRLMVVAGIVLLGGCRGASKSVGHAGSPGPGVGGGAYPAFFKVGHRGTRGLMPENTIPAMEKGLEAGANTLELDVHISRDGQVLVYHDESFNPDYTSMPDGSDIPKDQRKKYTFYQMDYPEIRKFVIGRKDYPAFPRQRRMDCYTPLVGEMIDSVEAYASARRLSPPYWLVEIKSKEKTDGFDQPAPDEFIRLLLPVLDSKRLGRRLIVQSFDVRPLQVIHRLRPDIALGYLTDDKNAGFSDNIRALGFEPAFYNPNFHLVTPELLKQCHERHILVEPWTVETADEMGRMKALGVDGIITDYPDLLQ